MTKKISLPLFAIAALMLMASCGKEYTCTCTVSINGAKDHVIYNNLGKVSKKDAEQQCSDDEMRNTDVGNSVSADCHL